MDKFECLLNRAKELESLVSELAVKKQLGRVSDSTSGEETNSLGDCDHRVIHFNDNPADLGVKKRRTDIERLKMDNERLRARLSLLESYNGADLTYRIDDAIKNVDEIEVLTQRVEELRTRENKVLTKFKESNREYREACYLLTGYRIEPMKDDVYRLTHMYDDQEGHNLYFEVKSDGTISLLENDYLNEYKELMSDYLEKADSFPAFLAAITLKLFSDINQLDVSVDMSTTMCTTMIENKLER